MRGIFILKFQFSRIKFMLRVKHVVNGDRFARNRCNLLRQAIHFGQRNIHRPSHVSNGSAGFHSPKRNDLRHSVRAVAVNGITNQFFPLVIRVIQVKIGHGNSAWIEKSLKNEVVFQGVNQGNADSVSDNRTRPRATHIPPNVTAAGIFTQIPHNQVINRKAHAMNNSKFMLLTCLHFRRIGLVAIPFHQSLIGQVTQKSFVGITSGHRIGR